MSRQESDVQRLREYRAILKKQLCQRDGGARQISGQTNRNQISKVNKKIPRLIKAKERALQNKIRKNYDRQAPARDIIAQLAGDDSFLKPIQALQIPRKYTFEKCARIARFFPNRSFVLKDMRPGGTKTESGLMIEL